MGKWASEGIAPGPHGANGASVCWPLGYIAGQGGVLHLHCDGHPSSGSATAAQPPALFSKVTPHAFPLGWVPLK